MVATIGQAIDTLADLPGRGKPVGAEAGGLRELIVPFGRSAYIVRYGWTVGADELVVVRIRHSREGRGSFGASWTIDPDKV